MDRISRLLQFGYLPSQLPPSFTTQELAINHSNLYSAWCVLGRTKTKSPATRTEIFSVARAGHQRRITSIPNPVAQTFLCKNLIDHWASIVQHFRTSKLSASHPRFRRNGTRAASLPSMKLLYEKKLLKSAGYRYALRTDISRFFPTIYTHTIPWAIHEKSIAKNDRSTTTLYGNLLDMSIRQCQDEQTIGIPIGPDTSHIIAESIATAIDKEFTKNLQKIDFAGFRYVDDYYLFFTTYTDAETALAELVKCLKKFELQVNFEKTKICKTDELTEDSWTHTLRNLDIAFNSQRQRSDINLFFETSRNIAKHHADESVMVYALRRASSVIIKKSNWGIFEAQLCSVATSHPVTLQTIARILSTYNNLGYPLNKPAITRLINSLISEHGPLEHHSEVAWCLWMCKDLGITIKDTNIHIIKEMSSSICILILLDIINSKKTIYETISLPNITDLNKPDALMQDLWMLSYEAGLRGWGGVTNSHISKNKYFDELKKLNIRFYDPDTKLAPLFSINQTTLRKRKQTTAEVLEFLDSDDLDDLDEMFIFKEESDEYGNPIEHDADDADDADDNKDF